MHRNALIDGWRGLSVALVIFGHLVGFRFHEIFSGRPFRDVLADSHIDGLALAKQVALRLLDPLPEIGVNIFFVISGFLITSLLIKEENERGAVSIAAFYVRRAFRIIPAFFAYLAAVYALTNVGAISATTQSLLWSGCFLCDLLDAPCTWWLGHTWSLSVEEQYYLAWPALFVLLRRWRVHGVVLALGALLASSFIFPLALSFAHIAVGGVYALSSTMRNIIDRLGTSKMISVFTGIILIQPFLASFMPAYRIAGAAGPLMLATIFFGTLNGRGPFAPLVRSEWLRRFGVVSYSVYLWQQLFTGRPAGHDHQILLSIPILFIGPALLSYYALEKPLIAVGHRLSDAIKNRAVDRATDTRTSTYRRAEPIHTPKGTSQVDIPRIFNVSESAHRIHNPFTPEKLATLGAALRLEPGTRVLDLGSGSGEMLCTWARDYGVCGTGIDMSRLFTSQAKLRAQELGVADRVEFIHGDAAGYVADEKVGVAACVGATWIGGGAAGTIELLAKSLRTGGIILVGEPYWLRLPPTEDVAKGCRAGSISDFLLLPELLVSFGGLGYDVVEMVLADQDSWDRYEAAKWLTMRRWLEANPGDDFAKEVRAELTSAPERYAKYAREYLGWGVFALMAR